MSEILTGDCTEKLAELPANSIHMCMTSPPYWNLRDYDHQDQLGLEADSDAYVQNLCDALDGVKRVLREDGSLWLNLGDTYENKDLQQIPARVALELQNRGWILRNRVTWNKPNPMPEAVKDRLKSKTEAIFHFTNKRSYYYNLDQIRRSPKQKYDGVSWEERKKAGAWAGNKTVGQNSTHGDVKNTSFKHSPKGVTPGDVFEISTKPFPDAHFAVYPPELCEKPIKATCPEDGVVLDPFAGAGTTLLKAKELGRDFIGIELNPEYADMARGRVGLEPEHPDTLRESDEQQGLEQF